MFRNERDPAPIGVDRKRAEKDHDDLHRVQKIGTRPKHVAHGRGDDKGVVNLIGEAEKTGGGERAGAEGCVKVRDRLEHAEVRHRKQTNIVEEYVVRSVNEPAIPPALP